MVTLVITAIVAVLFYVNPANAQQILPAVKLDVGEDTVFIGQEAVLPINVADLHGRYFSTAQMRITFDSTMLEFKSVTHGYLLDPNTNLIPVVNGPGDITLGIFPQAEGFVIENGPLVYLHFIAKSAGSAIVELRDLKLNGGKPESAGISGYVRIYQAINVSGQVVHGANKVPVSGVNVTIYMLNPLSMTTEISGSFAFSLPYDSSFATILEKKSDINDGTVSVVDVTILMRCALKMPYLIDPEECIINIGDVDNDGEITLYDAWLTLRYIVGYKNESSAGTYFFSPGNVSYGNMRRDLVQLQYAFIKGNVSMNPPAEIQAMAASNFHNISMTGDTNRLQIQFSDTQFVGVMFEITSTSQISITGVTVNGFKAEYRGGVIAISNKEMTNEADIVIDIQAPIGAHVDIVNLKVDEYQPIEGVVASLDLEEESEQIFHNQIHLPFLEKEILNLGDEEMPILEPDQL